VSGEVRLHSTGGGGVDEVNPGSLLLCQMGGSHCQCPGQHTTFPKGDLAITGGSTGATVKLIGLSDCPTIPAQSCAGLFSLSDFPGATLLMTNEIAPLSFCEYSNTDYPGPDAVPPYPPVIDGGVSLATFGSATMAHQYFLTQLSHCHGCGGLIGVGDEAAGTNVFQEETNHRYPDAPSYELPGRESFARIDNDIVTVTIWPAKGDPTFALLRKAIGELLATVKK
jgi:hypothetical protein